MNKIKKCKICNQYKENMKTQQRCNDCDKNNKLEKQKQYKMKKTKLNPISKKRQTRLQWYSEKDFFKDIKNEREPKCEVCWSFINEFKAHCFAHLLPKWQYPEYRLTPNNIVIVCSLNCHSTLDKQVADMGKGVIKQLLDEWKDWDI